MTEHVRTKSDLTSAGPKIGIILPSFNDPRIVHAIRSVVARDPTGLTRIYVVDGGSKAEILDLIGAHLRPHDQLRSERDRGIFDALNKGLDRVEEDIIGWIGSDDCFTKDVDFQAICDAFETECVDCLVYDLVFIDGTRSRRRTKAFAATIANVRLGRHVQHFSSFWRKSRIGSERFDLQYKIASDIDFFCKMALAPVPKTKISHTIVTIGRLGGNSTKSLPRIIRSNLEVYRIFRKYIGLPEAIFATVCKMTRKFASQCIDPAYPVIDELTDLLVKTPPQNGDGAAGFTASVPSSEPRAKKTAN